jgi:hypothetical protein
MNPTPPQQPHEKKTLEGHLPSLATEKEILHALDQAFDYRGDITLTLKNGQTIEGYLFDRKVGKTLTDSFAKILPKDNSPRMTIPYADIAKLEFTGKDTAHGKSFDTWLKKYQEKKAAGESNIRIEPEALE